MYINDQGKQQDDTIEARCGSDSSSLSSSSSASESLSSETEKSEETKKRKKETEGKEEKRRKINSDIDQQSQSSGLHGKAEQMERMTFEGKGNEETVFASQGNFSGERNKRVVFETKDGLPEDLMHELAKEAIGGKNVSQVVFNSYGHSSSSSSAASLDEDEKILNDYRTRFEEVLRKVYKEQSNVYRLFRDDLDPIPIKDCYINLAIIQEYKTQEEKDLFESKVDSPAPTDWRQFLQQMKSSSSPLSSSSPPLRAKESDSSRRVVRGSRGLSSQTELPESQRSQASAVSDDKLSSASSHLRGDLQCASVHVGIGDEDGRGNLGSHVSESILGMDERNLSRDSDSIVSSSLPPPREWRQFLQQMKLSSPLLPRLRKNIDEIKRDASNDIFEKLHNPTQSILPADIFKLNISQEEQLIEKGKIETVSITGRAGAGKSTFCHYLVYLWATKTIWKDNSESKYVIWIPLRELISYAHSTEAASQERSIVGFLYQQGDLGHQGEVQLGDVLRKEMPNRKILDRLLDEAEGQTCYVLDGYDELGNLPEGHIVWKLVNALLKKKYYIVTTRPHYSHKFEVDRRLEIMGFVDENINAYIQQYFQQEANSVAELQQGKELYDYLVKNKVVWGIAHVPIQLELMCLIWRDNKDILRRIDVKHLTMTALYSVLTNYLLQRYLESLSGRSRYPEQPKVKTEKYIEKKCEIEICLLEYIALKGLLCSELLITSDIVEDALDFAREKFGIADIDLQSVLETGLIKSVGAGKNRSYYFLHLTFQEYFVASHIKKSLTKKAPWCLADCNIQFRDGSVSRPYQNAMDFITWRKYNARYEVVWWFVVGLLSKENKTETLLNVIKVSPNDTLNLRNALLLIRLLEEDQKNHSQAYWQRLFQKISDYCLFSAGYTGKLEYDLLSQFNERLVHALSLSPFLVSNKGLLDPIMKTRLDLGVHDDSNQKKQLLRFLKNLGLRDVALSEGIINNLFKLVSAESVSGFSSEASVILQRQTSFVESAQRHVIKIFVDDGKANVVVYDQIMSGQTKWFISEKLETELIAKLNSDVWNVKESAIDCLARSKLLSIKGQSAFINILSTGNKQQQEVVLAILSKVDFTLCSELQLQLICMLSNTESWSFFQMLRDILYKQETILEDSADQLFILLGGKQKALHDIVVKLLKKHLQNQEAKLRFEKKHAGEKFEHYRALLCEIDHELPKKENPQPDVGIDTEIINILVRQQGMSDETIQICLSEVTGSEKLQNSLVEVAFDDGNPTQSEARKALESQRLLCDNIQCRLVSSLDNMNQSIRDFADTMLKKQTKLCELAQGKLVDLLYSRFSNLQKIAKAILAAQIELDGFTQQALVSMLTKQGHLASIGYELLEKQKRLIPFVQCELAVLFQDKNKLNLNQILKNQKILHPNTQLVLVDCLIHEDINIADNTKELLSSQPRLDTNAQVRLVKLLSDFDQHHVRHIINMVSVLENKGTPTVPLKLTLLKIFQHDKSLKADRIDFSHTPDEMKKMIAKVLNKYDLSSVLLGEESVYLSNLDQICMDDQYFFGSIYTCFASTPIDILFEYQQQVSYYSWLAKLIVKRCVREVAPICYEKSTHTLFSYSYPTQQQLSIYSPETASQFFKEMEKFLKENDMQLCEQPIMGSDGEGIEFYGLGEEEETDSKEEVQSTGYPGDTIGAASTMASMGMMPQPPSFDFTEDPQVGSDRSSAIRLGISKTP